MDIKQYTVEEYKDKKSENRIRVTHMNGNKMYSSTEGYKNLKDCVHASVVTSLALLDHYKENLTPQQVGLLQEILYNSTENNAKV